VKNKTKYGKPGSTGFPGGESSTRVLLLEESVDMDTLSLTHGKLVDVAE
jgi:hypothetical protein